MNINANLGLFTIIPEDEKVLWHGKPHKICLFLESIFNRMMPIAICWGLFDLIFMIFWISANSPLLIKFIIIPFMALHLMPVWIYLGGVIPAVLSYKNIYYAITNKALYISAGAFKQVFERRDLNDIANITMRRGFWDNILDLGDINITFKNSSEQYPLTRNGFPLHNIWEYLKVYKLLLETATKTSNDETNRQIQK